MSNRTSLDIARLVSPLGIDTFLERYWEREPLHIARDDAHFYADLFSLAELDTLLVQSRMTSRDLRVFSKQSGLAYEALNLMDRGADQRNRGPDLRPLHEAYRNGQSVIVEMRRLWPQLDRLCRAFEQAFRRKVSAELYMTPRRSQAFDVHYDLVDVFLLQLDGAKTWHVYEPIMEAPSPVHRDGRNCAEQVGDPKYVFEVKKGDLLYMPCGFPHQGITSDTSSLHISVGVTALYLHDLLKMVVDFAAREHAALRRPLRGAFAHPRDAGLDAASISQCLQLLNDESFLADALAQIEESFFDSLDQVPDGQFAEIDGTDEIAAETLLERRTDQFCVVRSGDETATLRFVGGGVSGPSWLAEQFNWVAATPRFRAEELPGEMSLDSKLVLTRRLVKEGLLRKARGEGNGAY
jgi:ribosomal protein L16 Arg81 hydroxylase